MFSPKYMSMLRKKQEQMQIRQAEAEKRQKQQQFKNVVNDIVSGRFKRSTDIQNRKLMSAYDRVKMKSKTIPIKGLDMNYE